MSFEDLLKAQGLEVVGSGDASREEQPKQEVESEAEVKSEAEEVKDKEETPQPEAKAEAEEKSFEDSFKEKYGSLEDLEAKLSSLEEKASASKFEDKYESDSIDRLEKVLESGFSWEKIKEIADIKTLNVDSLDGRQALSKMLEMKDGLSTAEINAKLREYDKLKDADIDLMDDDEKIEHKAALARYDRLQKESKDFLNSVKNDEKYSLPDLKKPTDDKELIEKQQKEFEELKNRYESSVSESLKEFNSVSFKLGEDNEFTFELNDEMKQKVQERMNGINEYYSNFVSANGVDYNNMKETIAKELFFDQILKSAVESNINKGEINAVKEINNVVDKSKKSQAPSSNASVQDQIIDGFLKGQGIR
tara:strand:- start:735 stop:1826 length:1092 start_codon:yes stop_codon:yes gene_type:complete